MPPKLRLRDPFVLDSRSLRCFTFALGLVCAGEMLQMLPYAQAFFGEKGVFPAAVFNEEFGFHHFSLFFIEPFSGMVYVWLSLGILSALMLALGVRPKLSGFVLWIVLVSIWSRNPPLMMGGECYLTHCLLWWLFIPQTNEPRFFSWFNVGLVLQVAMLYFITGLLKNGSDWVVDHSAVARALNYPSLATAQGLYFLRFPRLLKIVTEVVRWVEIGAPLLLLAPMAPKRVRTVVVLSLMLMHVIFSVFIRLGAFSYLCVVCLIPLLPSEFWDALKIFLKVSASRPKPLARPIRLARNALYAGLLGYTLVLGAAAPGFLKLPRRANSLACVLILTQTWHMFAPNVNLQDFTYRVDGVRPDASVISFWRTGADSLLNNFLWRNFFLNMHQGMKLSTRHRLGRYLCQAALTIGPPLKEVEIGLYPLRVHEAPRGTVEKCS